MSDEKQEWYFNTVRQVPEMGKKSRIEDRIGPYSSRDAALKAWKIVQERNKKWEDDDKEWNADWGKGAQSQADEGSEPENGSQPS
jgi:hypothetical protein